MVILIGLILALLTLAFVLYPFFTPQRLAVSVKTKAPAKREALNEDEIEKQILNRRKLTGLFCSQCGVKNQMNARFCAKCGANLSKGMKRG